MKKTLLSLITLCTSIFAFAENPLITTMYTADPTARVINGKLFLFPSSDVAPVEGKGNNGFYMPYYHVFSSENLIDWCDHGRQIDQNDIPWGQKDSYALWAPTCIEKDGKYYYYFPAQPNGSEKGHRVGVAVASNPEGPYTIEPNPIEGVSGIDPDVFIDDDGTPYIYWGCGDNMLGCKLKPNMKELDGTPKKITSLPPMYKEASFVFKRNGIYYFTFSHATPYRNCELSYATSDSPLGEFQYQGAFMKQWDDCWTNHHSIVEYNGDWLLFYHHADISGKSKMRSTCADYLTFRKDGRINMVEPTVRGVGIQNASAQIQIDRYSDISEQGVNITRLGSEFPANWQAEKCENGGWIRYNNVDFSDADYQSIRVRSASADMKKAKRLVVRENGYYGEVIAEVNIPSTNNWADFLVVTANLKYSPKSTIDLFCMIEGDEGELFSVDWVQFSTEKKEKEKSLVDFFLPMEPQSALTSDVAWGDDNVRPRDVKNGIEGVIDNKLEWCYWDGGVVKGDDGKYHLYCSRWNQSFAHGVGWKEDSKAIYAVSDNIMGPYEDKGLIWAKDDGGKAHNVFGFRLNDGRYGVVTSEITDGIIYVADKPEGPFKKLGNIEIDTNGKSLGLARYGKAPYHMSNVQVRPHPSGKGYMLICRSTAVLISEDNVLGPYKIMTGRVYEDIPELAKNYNEDPTMWYSGGLYHIVYNHWPSKISHHFVSKDGINDWKYCGEAFNKGETKIFKYSDGTINDWEFIERPTAIVGEDGHVSHFIFSVIDVHKGQDGANDNHASKIIVVPFDGAGFDKYMNSIVNAN
ncbi:MAG: family 43 glycosylhydrolase [Rikenellaceae bacterium]